MQTSPENMQETIDRATQAVADVFSFWQSMSMPIPQPSPTGWKSLQERVHDVIQLVRKDGDTKLAQGLAGDSRELENHTHDWSTYHAFLVSLLRKLVAHYDDY